MKVSFTIPFNLRNPYTHLGKSMDEGTSLGKSIHTTFRLI
jgi:hypothetical protein